MTAAQAPCELPADPTPCTLADMLAALRAAGVPDAGLALAAAHSALETGWWRSMRAHNPGNRRPGPGLCWTFFACGEELRADYARAAASMYSDTVRLVGAPYDRGGVAMQSVEFLPRHPASRFAAFRTLAEGVADHVAMLRDRFPRAWSALPGSDPRAYAAALYADRYFTADPKQYGDSLAAVLAEVQRQMAITQRMSDEDLKGWYQDAISRRRVRRRSDGSVVSEESPAEHLLRIGRSLDGVSLTHHGELLAKAYEVDEADAAHARQVASMLTNCGTSARVILALAGCRHPLVTRPYEVGMAVAWDLQAAREMGCLHSGARPHAAWFGHYANRGANNDHIEWCGSEPDAAGNADHFGGGRADNAITWGHGSILVSNGRPLLEVVDAPSMCPEPLAWTDTWLEDVAPSQAPTLPDLEEAARGAAEAGAETLTSRA